MTYTARMNRQDKPRSGIALGGIGAGWFELRQDGIFRNWNIHNNHPFGTGEPLDADEDTMLFFAVRYEVEGESPRMKILQIDEGYHVGNIQNHHYSFPWMTGVEDVEFAGEFPFCRLRFTDDEMPLIIDLEAFSPFIPHDVKNSSLPVAVFDFRVRSTAYRPVHVMLMASMHNVVGYDFEDKFHITRIRERAGCKRFTFSEGGMDTAHSSWGTQALASLSADSTHYTGWEVEHPYYEEIIRSRRLPNVDRTDERNEEDPDTGKLHAQYEAFGSLAVSRRLEYADDFSHSFLMGWHFPNFYDRGGQCVGHYYGNFFADADEVVNYAADNLHELRSRARGFLRDFYDSSAPRVVLDQVHSHLNTFFTSAWLTQDGNFGIQEGMSPHRPYGPLATVDVSTYGAMSTAALFPELLQSMMRAHRRLQAPSGEIGHGINRDFSQTDVQEAVTGRLDLPSQFTILALMGYFWTGDEDYLREMWPGVKMALDYVLRERDMNGDFLPDMEGSMCTYDNFRMYGAASYVSSLWLAALSQATAVAQRLNDQEAAERYAKVLEKAQQAFEQKLWNGRYYRLFNDAGGEHGQDEGCLTDQLIGQWTNHLVGAPYVVFPERVRSALKAICEMSRQPWGLVNCRWPEDEFLHPVPASCWHDQANTCWSGVELAFASFLIYEGIWDEGVGVIENVDRRYRHAGMYWDHIEFGGHYYRPMSAWAILNAVLGLAIDDGHYTFEPKLPKRNLKLFFSFANGTAHYVRSDAEEETHALSVRTGVLQCDGLRMALLDPSRTNACAKLNDDELAAETVCTDGRLVVQFDEAVRVPAGSVLEICVD